MLWSLPPGLNKGKYLEKDMFAESSPLRLDLFRDHISVLIKPKEVFSIALVIRTQCLERERSRMAMQTRMGKKKTTFNNIIL